MSYLMQGGFCKGFCKGERVKGSGGSGFPQVLHLGRSREGLDPRPPQPGHHSPGHPGVPGSAHPEKYRERTASEPGGLPAPTISHSLNA